MSYSPHLLLTHPSLPVKTTRADRARKDPSGKLNYPTSLGGAPHMAGLAFAQRTGINWVYVPTKGGPQTVQAVLSGEGDAFFLGILQTLAHVNSGKLKLLAVSSEQRLPNLPKTPTVAETLPGFVTGSWQGILAPPKIPRELLAKLNAEIARILQLPDVKQILESQGTVPIGNSSEDARKMVCDRARPVGEGHQGEWFQAGTLRVESSPPLTLTLSPIGGEGNIYRSTVLIAFYRALTGRQRFIGRCLPRPVRGERVGVRGGKQASQTFRCSPGGALISPHRYRRHGRARRSLHLQRLQDERELVHLLRGKLVELHVLEQVHAVHHQCDLVHGQGELFVGVR